MCIYCGTNNYRRIYESHFGSIPKGDDGRSYHIHHLDGNHDNNHYMNLICLSEVEHYEKHLSQGDWKACQILAVRMKKSFSVISELARKGAVARVHSGDHNLLAKGKYSPVYNHTIYTFQHIETGNIVNMTLYDFCLAYELHKPNVCLLINGRRKTHKGWKLYGNDHVPKDRKGSNNSQYDNTIHLFKNNNTGQIVSMTQYEFKNTFNLNSGHVTQLIKLNTKVKSVKGWSIISE